MKELFTVGEIAKLFDINKKTLRYYDEIDLFKPSYVDKLNNYRYYTTHQFDKLNTIIYLKNMHMPLDKIKEHLENTSIDNALNLFKIQAKTVEDRIEELKSIQVKIQDRINKIEDSIDYNKLNKIVEIEFPNRKIFVLKERITTNDDLELSIRKLENKANKKSSIFLGEVGVLISKEKLKASLFKEYDFTFIFAEDETSNSELLRILSKGKYVCIRFNGLHNDSSLYYEKLLEYIKDNNYEIIEDAIEITLIDSGLTKNKSEFVTEIQILVKKY